MHHIHYNTPPNTTYTHMYHMDHNPYMFTTKHHYVPGKFYVPGKILYTTCTTMNHMHYNALPNTTMHHIHTHVPHGPEYTCLPQNTTMYQENFMYHMHHHVPHTHIYTTLTTIDVSVQQKILCTRKNCMYHMHHKTPPCTTKHHHVPPNTTKNKIYLVGLPSTLYERPCQCDRFEVKQLILMISHEIHWISRNLPDFT